MGLFKSKEEKETQKLQRQEYLAKARQELKERDDAKHDLNRSEMTEEDTMSNLSDREIQLEMLKAIKSTNGWIIFIGVVTLVNVIGAVIVAVSLLN